MSSHVPKSGAFAARPVEVERYVCLDLLGSGGMGQVWRARDTLLDREVALKTVASVSDSEMVQRLEREARFLAKLRSEGTVVLLDRGELADGRPFLALELLETPALGRSEREDLGVLLHAARAVGDAHRSGVVHRDLKPSNLALRGSTGVVLDWGLAKPVAESGWDSRGAPEAPLTATGVSVGTVGYMAPEQLSAGPVRPESDVWSLAAMLHEVVTGVPPWTDGGHQLLAAVSEGTLDVPEGPVGEVIRRGLMLRPERRLPDGHAFAEALQAAITTVEVARTPPRWPIGVALLAGLALAGLGVLLAGGGEGRPPVDPQRAELLVELGQLYVEGGRLLEARAHGAEADALASTPASRGLLALPVAPEPVIERLECDSITLGEGADRFLCTRDGETELHDRGRVVWRRPEATRHWLGPSAVVEASEWSLVRVPDEGSPTELLGAVRDVHLDVAVGVHADWVVSGDALVERMADGSPGRRASAGRFLSSVRVVGGEVVGQSGVGLFRSLESGLQTIGPFDEPVVHIGEAGGRIAFVGLRGLVVEVDAYSFVELDRYRLRGVEQVERAAWDGRRLAVSTRHGLFTSQKGEVALQLTTRRPESLAFLPDGRLRAWMGDDGLWSFSLEASGLLVPARDSTTAFQCCADPAVAVGRATYVFDPESLVHGLNQSLENGPVRSVVRPGFAVDNFGAYRWPERTPLGPYPVMALLDDGTAIGAKRWDRGVAVFGPAFEKTFEESPIIRDVVTDFDGEHALGRTVEGGLVRISREGAWSALPVEGVRRVAAGPLGRLVSRGAEVELVGVWTAECVGEVDSLAVGREFVAAGTFDGRVCVFDGEGARVLELRAHPERVSALMIWGDWLFTGSWAPGIRRWKLPGQSWQTSSSPG